MQMTAMAILIAALLSLSIADRCREICEKVNYTEQCGTCLNRPPIRFGKRSSPVAIPPPLPKLLSLLRRAAGVDTPNIPETHMLQYATGTGDKTLPFQLDYQ